MYDTSLPTSNVGYSTLCAKKLFRYLRFHFHHPYLQEVLTLFLKFPQNRFFAQFVMVLCMSCFCILQYLTSFF